jgi:hypothetical protein
MISDQFYLVNRTYETKACIQFSYFPITSDKIILKMKSNVFSNT